MKDDDRDRSQARDGTGEERGDCLAREVGAREKRKVRARREGDRTVWFGLGMFGLVGWSVAVPTLLALALGVWIDSVYETERSWTLMMLALGIGLGCFNAWYWVSRESRAE